MAMLNINGRVGFPKNEVPLPGRRRALQAALALLAAGPFAARAQQAVQVAASCRCSNVALGPSTLEISWSINSAKCRAMSPTTRLA